MTHEEYKNTLFKKKQISYEMKRMQSRSHQLGTHEVKKISRSCFDGKGYVLEYILDNEIKTLLCRSKDIT